MSEDPTNDLLDPNAIFDAIKRTYTYNRHDRHVIILEYLLLLHDLQDLFESAGEEPKTGEPFTNPVIVSETHYEVPTFNDECSRLWEEATTAYLRRALSTLDK